MNTEQAARRKAAAIALAKQLATEARTIAAVAARQNRLKDAAHWEALARRYEENSK